MGHGANSQFGPTLPTLDPSGHTFASIVHALVVPEGITGFGIGTIFELGLLRPIRYAVPAVNTIRRMTTMMIIATASFIFTKLFYHYAVLIKIYNY